ncbi:MAG: 4-hydroxy-3-methylbut-2-enyl diphosphate reductase [Candidatus Magnetomorum sp.]|nr:4-hydroxy-3-methylbut-2-enyl diphosphate reductase [Candidatus Magnetomorum sp.]
MKLTLARTAGFCMGVRRAVDMVLDASNRADGSVYTYGPLIHNSQVLDILKNKGISVLDYLPESGNGTVLIRAHGVPPSETKQLEVAGFSVIDATCPRVIKVQTIIHKYAKAGYDTLILGDADHAEVKGLMGYTHGKGHVVQNLDELQKLPEYSQAIMVAQTTQNHDLFSNASTYLESCHPHYLLFNTICDSTSKRQVEVKDIAKESDAVVIVGGKNSGNTQRLTQIVQQQGIPAYHIETEDDLPEQEFQSYQRVGITAGASTPNWIINRVCHRLEALSSTQQGLILKSWQSIQQTLLLTNLFVGLGAGCLAFACMCMQGIPPVFQQVMMAFLYVLSMHTLNNYISRKAERYNYPYRAAFYEKFRLPLLTMAFSAGLAGLILAYYQGPVAFIILLTMSILGMAYKVRILPPGMTVLYNIQKIQDIPGSKTILIAVAWGVVTSILPSISANGSITFSSLSVFMWSTGLVFARSAFFDLLDIQGNRIVGQETLPGLLGEKRTMKLLRILSITLFLCGPIFYFFGLTHVTSVFVCISSILFYYFMQVFEKKRLLSGTRLNFFVESHFIVCGIMAWIPWWLTI